MAEIPPVCEFGWQAKEFNLPSVDGKKYTLEEVGGSNGLLIMFICNHCPYVLAILDRIVRDASDLQQLGVGIAAISSNDVISYSNLDALLANVAVVPETVFDALPDPFDRLAFQNALEKEASLNTDQVYRIFEGLTGGQSESITKARLGELQRTSHRYLGLEGSNQKNEESQPSLTF